MYLVLYIDRVITSMLAPRMAAAQWVGVINIVDVVAMRSAAELTVSSTRNRARRLENNR
jgi:hypothetical protein